MSKRCVASGTICFGLVSIPVKFYLPASADSVHFSMITSAGHRVNQELVDAITRERVERSQCLKGYEIAKGQYVTFTDEEIKALDEQDNGTLEIREFVPLHSVDVLHVEKSYWLDAAKGGDRAYRLLSLALVKRDCCAVAQWINRGRHHLVVIEARNGALVAHQMFYAHEVRQFELDAATYEPKDAELQMACQLIDAQRSDDYDSSKYIDSYRERVMKAVEKKQSGASPVTPTEQQAHPVMDLFAALQASLKSGKAKVETLKTKEKSNGKKKRGKVA
jgi:Uncharacterized conserved protein